mmetsp:Transcript_18421/g.27741  ORF Transcript_18421/g.27741 Transcript_18421/m.27741 type:complete len:358 (+) Transcript_18421:27-1100(+)
MVSFSFVLVLFAKLTLQKPCTDQDLWVDGIETTCANSGLDCKEWFCPNCIYAKTCDTFCGYTTTDCQGNCLTDTQCLSEKLGYFKCVDWLGNGCCDDGYSYTTDTGIQLDFNCAKFDYDNGDCQPPTSPPDILEPINKKEWCILLTSTICPVQGATHVVRRSAHVRRQDYRSALVKYKNRSKLPIILVENSAANLSEFIMNKIQVISFRDKDPRPNRGKGHSEYRSILHALTHSNFLNCSHIIKITGRYYISNLDSVITQLQNLNPQPDVVVQSTPSPWTLWDGVLRSEVVAFKNDPQLIHFLFANQDEAIGNPMERVLFNAVRQLKQEKHFSVAEFPKLDVDPIPNAEQTHIISVL